MRLLYVEDERDLNEIVAQRLAAEGYSVDRCFDGGEALECMEAVDYDGMILDIMLPCVSGLELLKRVRAQGKKTPVLLLTARDAVEDRVLGLDSGANDYLVKPFALSELLARVRAMLRAPFGMADNRLFLGDLSMDCASRTVERGGKPLSLSAREYALLEYLLRNQGVVLTREQIEDHIWNLDYEGGTNVVDVYISYLRRKVDGGREKPLIHTVRGAGYVIREDAP